MWKSCRGNGLPAIAEQAKAKPANHAYRAHSPSLGGFWNAMSMAPSSMQWHGSCVRSGTVVGSAKNRWTTQYSSALSGQALKSTATGRQRAESDWTGVNRAFRARLSAPTPVGTFPQAFKTAAMCYCDGGSGGGFFVAYEDFGARFLMNQFPCALYLVIYSFIYLFIFSRNHSRTPVSLFKPGSVHSGSASWDDFGRAFPDEIRVSSFMWKVPTLCQDSIVSPLRFRWA